MKNSSNRGGTFQYIREHVYVTSANEHTKLLLARVTSNSVNAARTKARMANTEYWHSASRGRTRGRDAFPFPPFAGGTQKHGGFGDGGTTGMTRDHGYDDTAVQPTNHPLATASG